MGVDDKDYPAEEKLEATYGGRKTDIETEPTHFSVPVDSGRHRFRLIDARGSVTRGTSLLFAGVPLRRSQPMKLRRGPRVWPRAATLVTAEGASDRIDLPERLPTTVWRPHLLCGAPETRT